MIKVSKWAPAQLKDVCELVNGRAYKQNELLEHGKYPVLRVGNFFSNPKWYHSDLELDDAKYCVNGDLLYAWSASFGPKIWDGQKAIFHYHIWRVELEERLIDKSYLYRWFQWDKDNIKAEHGTGSTMIHVTKGDMEARGISVPPLAEQRRIVEKLDALTARTARARTDLDRIPALAARYKQAVLAKAFSGELTADWRQDSPATFSGDLLRDQLLEQRAERRQAEGVRGAGANRSVPTDTRALPTLPFGWSWMTFDQCSWDLTVGHVGPMKDRYEPNGITFLRSLNIKPNAISLKNSVFISADFHAELKKSQLSAGTIVVIRTGEPGVAAVVPESLHGSNCSDLVICRPVDGLNPHFGARYINSDFAKSFIRDTQVGVAQQHFNVGAMSKLPLPVAPPLEQAEIVRRIDLAFADIDRMVTEAAAARRLLDRLDQAVLAKAFRGELVPQDPSDEPASVLLERIRVERADAPKAKRGRRKTAA